METGVSVQVFPLLAICRQCKVKHECWQPQELEDFYEKHRAHKRMVARLDYRWVQWQIRSPISQLWNRLRHYELFKSPIIEALAYTPNADVKQARQALQTLTSTSLDSLANSATAGWQSAEVDNSSNLYLDQQVQIILDFAATAPANSKGVYVFAAGGLETGKLSSNGEVMTGTQGTVTLADVTTNAQNLRMIGFMPYLASGEIVESAPMSVALGFGGVMPPYWALAVINHTGAAIAATGNTVKHAGIYATVV